MLAMIGSRLSQRFGRVSYLMAIFLLLLGKQTKIANSLYVDPESIAEPEGDEQVHFFCQENQGGSQATGITWRGPNGDLYTPGEPSGDERINVEGYRLTLYDVVREDSGTYECFRGSTESATGQLLVYAPPTILNPMPIQEIYFNMTSLLLCEIDGGNPPANVHWIHITYNATTGAQIIDEITAEWSPRFTIVENGLQIADVRASDEGVYRCYVQNNRGQEILDIRASFIEGPQFVKDDVELNIILAFGEAASLDCTAVGAPAPNITWSVPLNSQLSHSEALSGSVLDVRLSDGADAGQYKCTAQNEAGQVTRIFTLKLAIAPEPAVENLNIIMMIELEKQMKINCSVTALPEPDFKWLVGSTPLPASTWTSIYGDVMGISTLVFEFEKEHMDADCKIRLTCMASNAYGKSEQHYTLTPTGNIDCSENARRTTSSTPNPSPNILTNDQESPAGIEDSNSGLDDGEINDTTFKIIVASFTVAATVIVMGVVILMVYFLRHFCSRKKYSGQLKSVNPDICQHSNKNLHPSSSNPHVIANDGRAFSTTSSLHHSQGCTVETRGIEFTANRAGMRHESVDSGVSMSNHHPCQSRQMSNHNETAPPMLVRHTPSTSSTDADSEGIYHRLDHKLPSVSSFGSCSLSSTSKVRLLSVSSTTDSNSVFLTSQVSTSSDFEDSGGSASSYRHSQKRHVLARQNSHPTSIEHSTASVRRDSDTDSVGMIFNPSYESHKLKISTSADEPPHVYEKVA
ncbi:Neural cell adhesion molecule 1 [Geodia barretti]|uniref:Neural cell adhesion molecule 1 n=1 Tax=Geodia barretti TaxID=519541 RepID=A0AA35WUZ0_GEOBA|nr:Neural cell adhesion molecule 1 [Geodia barretti]